MALAEDRIRALPAGLTLASWEMLNAILSCSDSGTELYYGITGFYHNPMNFILCISKHSEESRYNEVKNPLPLLPNKGCCRPCPTPSLSSLLDKKPEVGNVNVYW